ncbi:hypothetical protein ACFL0D_05100 [Thermoproteota archaeon]
MFNYDFDQRLEIYQDALREQVKIENQEFVSKMQDVIELDPEAVEIDGLGKKWKVQLESGSRIKEESDKMRNILYGSIMWR